MAAPHPYNVEVPSRFREVQDTSLMRRLLRMFVRAAGFLPVWFMRFLAASVGLPIAIPLTYKNFRGIVKNLRRMDPRATRFRMAVDAWSVYKNYAYYLIDLLYLSHGQERVREYSFTITGRENLWQALEQGEGVILLTSHLGNWEIGGLALGDLGKTVNLAYAPDSSEIFERQRSRMRGGERVQSIILKPGGLNSLRIYRLLEAGELVALQGDRLLFDRGLRVPFFGASARFPQGPARIAQLSGSPVVPIFVPMKGYKAYEIIIDPPLEMEPGRSLEENAAKIVSVFEGRIRKHRTQWYTFEPFWEADQEEGPP